MKDPAADPDIVGYCGVLLTSHNEYQGFLLSREAEPVAAALLAKSRQMVREPGPVSQVNNPSPGIASEDQPLVGQLSATLVSCWMSGHALRIATVAGALRLLLRRDFFWIMASSRDSGISTTIYPLEAKSPLEARDAFQSQPAIMFVTAMRGLGRT